MKNGTGQEFLVLHRIGEEVSVWGTHIGRIISVHPSIRDRVTGMPCGWPTPDWGDIFVEVRFPGSPTSHWFNEWKLTSVVKI